MSLLLNIKQLCWKNTHQTILHNISLEIGRGEIIGIIGPNGAGKTSLLRCITNQVPNAQKAFVSGQVYLKNKEINQYSAKQLAQHFALVMQKNDATFSLSVLEIMKMGLLPHKTLFSLDTDHDLAQIKLALAKVGLAKFIHHTFNQLSGGEQQRVLIARALVQESEILILDEPTNHLDVYYQHQILRLVNQLNITVIMTVHDLNLASNYCQRLLLLEQGKLIADGPPENVLNKHKLEQVFKLPCQQDIDPITSATRVSFYLEQTSTTDKNEQGEDETF